MKPLSLIIWTGPRRQGCANPRRKVRGITGSMRGLIDVRSTAQFLEAHARVHHDRAVDEAVDQTVKQEAVVEATMLQARCTGIAQNVQRAVVAQQVVPLGAVG